MNTQKINFPSSHMFNAIMVLQAKAVAVPESVYTGRSMRPKLSSNFIEIWQ
jgi:hypothetical protein